jgi:hypothetical protein
MWLFLDMCIDLECVHERALEGHAMKSKNIYAKNTRNDTFNIVFKIKL